MKPKEANYDISFYSFRFNCCKTVHISEIFPQTCSDLTPFHGVDASGIYEIYPFGNSTGLLVYCDLKTAGGGWLVSILNFLS